MRHSLSESLPEARDADREDPTPNTVSEIFKADQPLLDVVTSNFERWRTACDTLMQVKPLRRHRKIRETIAYCLFDMDDALERYIESLPQPLGSKLGFSIEPLDTLENP